jgi:hypothetical protein
VLTGWALHLGGGPLAVGALGALPSLAQVLHLPAAWATSSLGRRRVALLSVALSRQAWLPLVFLPFLPLGSGARLSILLAWRRSPRRWRWWATTRGSRGWATSFPPRSAAATSGAAAAVCTVGGTLACLAAGFALDRARSQGREAQALSLLALVACLAGLATTALMARQHDPGEPARRPSSRASRPPPRRSSTRASARCSSTRSSGAPPSA